MSNNLIDVSIRQEALNNAYNKLVRDRIPEIIEKSGKRSVVEILGSEAYKKHLDETTA